ncbi:MAG: BrnT family toxin [Acidobacteriota bacterium]|nr:BrnT family toxin [Acidobacteriota bacterium]
MTVVFRLQGIEFEWDEDKAVANVEKHGITFDEAAESFFDPFYQTGDATVDEEPRNFIVVYTFDWHLLLVVSVERGVRTRIISARPATRQERRLYEQD